MSNLLEFAVDGSKQVPNAYEKNWYLLREVFSLHFSVLTVAFCYPTDNKYWWWRRARYQLNTHKRLNVLVRSGVAVGWAGCAKSRGPRCRGSRGPGKNFKKNNNFPVTVAEDGSVALSFLDISLTTGSHVTAWAVEEVGAWISQITQTLYCHRHKIYKYGPNLSSQLFMLYGCLVHVGETFNRFADIGTKCIWRPGSTLTRWGSYNSLPDPLIREFLINKHQPRAPY